MNDIAKVEQNQVITQQPTPQQMLMVAVEKGVDAEQLTKLMDLQERWEANEARKAFADALARFQSELGPIIKKQIVDYTTAKGRTTFAFANIDDIAQQIRPILERHGLSYRFSQTQEAETITVCCTVTHRLGHHEEASLSAVADASGGKNSIQAIASTVTYLRRYTLTGVLGITTGQDDNDGGKPAITVDELLKHNKTVRDEIYTIFAIKDALLNGDYSTAKEAWRELDEGTMSALWRAPTKGGIFTTEEIAKMKSNEWSAA